MNAKSKLCPKVKLIFQRARAVTMETPRRQETPLAPTERIKSAFKFTKTFGLEIFTDLFEATGNVQKCIPGMKLVKCLI